MILDFGLATNISMDALNEGPIAGTPAYMPPEQSVGSLLSEPFGSFRLVRRRCDALSCPHGRLPFTGDISEVLNDEQRMEPASPSTVVPDIPALDVLCRELLRRDASARPPWRSSNI